MNLPFAVDRSIFIQADVDTVFSFFVDPVRWAVWWGAGSTVEPRVGGAILIRHSNGFESTGEVIEIVPRERFVFTYSLQATRPVPAEESRVTLRVEPQGTGTLVSVTHQVADADVRDLLPQGWRFHFSLFANAVANLVHADAAALADSWFALWTEPDAAARTATLRRIATEDVRFADRYSCLTGIGEIETHIGASQRFMPGIGLERRGEVRHCQGTALADWVALKGGTEVMAGTNVFVFGAGGKFATVTGVTR
jgi:uncharacterized protein YndB with AHSA1/START domain